MDDRRETTLPVTAEVGSEGGSYADPTYQVATFEDSNASRSADVALEASAGEAIGFDTLAEGGDGTSRDPAGGVVRYPTEPPSPPSAREAWRPRALMRWGVVAAGAAAGAAVALILRRR